MIRKTLITLALSLIFGQIAIAENNKWPSTTVAQADHLVAHFEQTEGQSIMLRLAICDSMKALAAQHRDVPQIMWRALFCEAVVRHTFDDPEISQRLLDKAMGMVDGRRYAYDYGRIEAFKRFNAALCNKDAFTAFQVAKANIEKFTQQRDFVTVGRYYQYIGIIFNNMTESSTAISYLKKGQMNFKKSKLPIAAQRLDWDIAKSYVGMGLIDSSRVLIDKLLKNKAWNTDSLMQIRIHTIAAYCAPDSVTQAYHIGRMWQYTSQNSDSTLMMRGYTNMGGYLIGYGHYRRAIGYYLHAYRYMKSHNLANSMMPCLCALGDCYYALGIPDSAAIYYNEYERVRVDVSKASQMHLIKSEDFKNRIEEYEKSLADMNRKARTDLVITGLIILILIALTAILWMSRQKSRIAHQLAEEQNKRLSQNLEMEQLRNKQQLIEIELRDRRLVADAVQMTENEALLKGIHKTINEAAEGQTNTADVLRELNSQMLMHANNIKEWNTFEAYFEKVHPGFFVQLKKRCPRLTESELRLCAFLRMGMTNAQVASMLNIMPSSLKKSRFRIRKKLELDTADSLEDTLRNISTQ